MGERKQPDFVCPNAVEEPKNGLVKIRDYDVFIIVKKNPGTMYDYHLRPGGERFISEQDYNNWMNSLRQKGFITY